MNVSLQYAEEHLADLVSAADRGEEIVITRPEKPTLKLIVSPTSAPAIKSGRRILGAGRGELRVPSEQEWRQMDEEISRLMNSGPLFPPEKS
jgi:antitoxin (DNA-binding transcriptional repressor) of toxin-antitoxin stability system